MLREVSLDTANPLVEFDLWERGVLRRHDKAEGCYWLRDVGKNRLRTIRQHRQHLTAALGASPVLHLRDDVAAADEFLRLEDSGWKGNRPDGRALRREEGAVRFFETVCDRYLKSGRMQFLSLDGAGKPIAMLCLVSAGDGLFAYKTAYDEHFAKHGPGVEIFLAAMEHFDRETNAGFLDTCSARDNQHLLGLFPDRRKMATIMFRVPSLHAAG
jgi:hypothetical protein